VRSMKMIDYETLYRSCAQDATTGSGAWNVDDKIMEEYELLQSDLRRLVDTGLRSEQGCAEPSPDRPMADAFLRNCPLAVTSQPPHDTWM
jgi:hypothetical protein